MRHDNPHRIENTEFDFRFDSERASADRQESLGTFVRGQLLRVVEEVFDEASVAGKVARIDRIEVDLGSIPEGDFEGELVRRLRDKLREALAGIMAHGPDPDLDDSGVVVTLERSEREQLEFFLLHGRLPWNAEPASQASIEALAERTIARDAAAFATFLRRRGGSAPVVDRLVRQLPERLLEALVRVLAGPDSGNLLEALPETAGSGEPLPVGEDRRRRNLQAWSQLLDRLVRAPNRLDPESLIAPVDGNGEAVAGPGRDAAGGKGTAPASAALIRGHDLKERLRATLLGLEAGPVTEMVTVLGRDHPGQLIGLADDLYEVALEIPIPGSLTSSSWQALVGGMLAVRRDMGEPVDALSAAVAAFAARATDRSAFYGEIFQQMVAGGTIGMERAIAARTRLGDEPTAPRRGAWATAWNDEAPAGAEPDAMSRVVDYLEHGGPPRAPWLTPEIWERALAIEPERPHERLAPLLARPAAVERLIGAAADRVLTRLLERTYRNDHADIQETADLLERMWWRAMPDVAAARRRAIKWRGVFGYLFVDRKRYERGAFAQAMVSAMAAGSGWADTASFRQRLHGHARQVGRTLAGDSVARARFEQIVHTLEGPDAAEARPSRVSGDRGGDARASDRVIRGYDLRDEVAGALRAPRVGGEDRTRLRVLIEELRRDHPHQLIALYSEFEGPRASVDPGWSLEDLQPLRGAIAEVLSGVGLIVDPIAIAPASDRAADRPGRPPVVEPEPVGGRHHHGPVEGPMPRGSSEADLLDYLESGAIPGRLARTRDLERTLDEILAGGRGMSIRRLERLLVRVPVIERLVGFASDRLLTRILLRFRAADHARLQEAADVLDELSRDVRPALRRVERRRTKWRMVLDAVSREGAFDLGGFVSDYVRALGVESGQSDTASLRDRLARARAPSTRRLPVFGDVVRMLRSDSAQDRGAGNGPDAAGPDDEGPSPHAATRSDAVIRGYDLVDRLRRALEADEVSRSDAPDALVDTIEALGRDYPHHLMSLYAELGDPSGPRLDLGERLSGAEWRSLVTVLISVRRDQGERLDLLLDAVERYRARARDLAHFYRRLLEDLLGGGSIDLEAIAAEAPDSPAPLRLPVRTPDPVLELLSIVDGRAGAPSRFGADAIERLRALPPDRLRAVLFPALAGPSGADRLIASLPDSFLERLLDMLSATRGEDPLEPLAGVLIGAWAEEFAGSDHDAGRVRREKWNAAFQAVEGAGDDRRFVLGFLDALARSTGAGDVESFRVAIARRLQARPELGARVGAIVGVLTAAASDRPDKTPGGSKRRSDASAAIVRAWRAALLGESVAPSRREQDEPSATASMGSGGPTAVEMALDELVRRRPGTLLDLYLELKKAGPERLARFEGLPAGGWEHLLGALLAARRVAAGENLAELIAAIDRHARDAQDREHYHRTILVHLLGDRMIDPGAVAAESVPDRSGEAAPEASASRHTGDGQRHGQVRGDNLAELRRFLDSSARVEGPEAIQLVRLFEKMWVHQPALLVRWIEPVLSTRAGVDRLIGLLPDRILTRLLQRMRPSEHVELETAADLVVQLWRTADPVQSRGRLRSVRWRGIFDFVFVEGRRFSLSGFVDAFVGRLAEASGSSDLERFRRSLIDRIVVPDPAASLTLAVARVMGATDLPEPAAHAPVSSEPDIGQDDRPSGERIAVENAGLVIASPYLPTLFKRLGLTEGARFSNPEAAGRATHLLQYMVNRSTKTSEHELVLNKILCGVPTERPVDSGIEIRDTEVELIDGLILAMIEHWSKIGKTSVDGFRESFLQRRGVLVLKDPGWVLEVEERSYDVLLDSIPWSFSIVRHSWMERAIHVKWRSA